MDEVVYRMMIKIKRLSVLLGLLMAVSVAVSGCGDRKAKETEEALQQEISGGEGKPEAVQGESGAAENPEGGEDGVCTLYTDDKGFGVGIVRPEGFKEAEFSSGYQAVFQRMGADGTSSTQINLRLMEEDGDAAAAIARQEVEYLLSANSDEEGTAGELQTLAVGERQWSFFSYSMTGTEGYRFLTGLSNGCTLSCSVENIGSGLEPLSAEQLAGLLSACIQE